LWEVQLRYAVTNLIRKRLVEALALTPTHGWIRDSAIFHRDIEVDTDKDTLILEIKVCDRQFVRQRHRSGSSRLGVMGIGTFRLGRSPEPSRVAERFSGYM
jgi:hypothetical protein